MSDSNKTVSDVLIKLSTIESFNHSIKNDIETIKKILIGNGEPSDGMIVRFDRVEQSYLKTYKWLSAITTSIIFTIIANLGLLIKLLLLSK